MTLSATLRTTTGALHRQVEASPLIAQLLRGRLARRDYCALLRNLQPIYAALEARLPAAGLPAALSDPRLARQAALEADLQTLHGADWATALPIHAAAADYRDHLLGLDAPRLAAHAYVRYLGDLAGGQMLGRIVEQAYGETAAFHRFPAPGAAALATAFRAALDDMPLSDTSRQALVEEACAGFERHAQLFAALQPLRS